MESQASKDFTTPTCPYCENPLMCDWCKSGLARVTAECPNCHRWLHCAFCHAKIDPAHVRCAQSECTACGGTGHFPDGRKCGYCTDRVAPSAALTPAPALATAASLHIRCTEGPDDTCPNEATHKSVKGGWPVDQVCAVCADHLPARAAGAIPVEQVELLPIGIGAGILRGLALRPIPLVVLTAQAARVEAAIEATQGGGGDHWMPTTELQIPPITLTADDQLWAVAGSCIVDSQYGQGFVSLWGLPPEQVRWGCECFGEGQGITLMQPHQAGTTIDWMMLMAQVAAVEALAVLRGAALDIWHQLGCPGERVTHADPGYQAALGAFTAARAASPLHDPPLRACCGHCRY